MLFPLAVGRRTLVALLFLPLPLHRRSSCLSACLPNSLRRTLPLTLSAPTQATTTGIFYSIPSYRLGFYLPVQSTPDPFASCKNKKIPSSRCCCCSGLCYCEFLWLLTWMGHCILAVDTTCSSSSSTSSLLRSPQPVNTPFRFTHTSHCETQYVVECLSLHERTQKAHRRFAIVLDEGENNKFTPGHRVAT